MENGEKQEKVCRSVFKSGESTTTASRFTKEWIELINKMEKNKEITAARQE